MPSKAKKPAAKKAAPKKKKTAAVNRAAPQPKSHAQSQSDYAKRKHAAGYRRMCMTVPPGCEEDFRAACARLRKKWIKEDRA